MGIAADIAILLVAGLLGGLVAQRLRQPLLVGYILAGIAVGPYTGGITVAQVHDIELLAEIGVALLLFSIGLEFSLGDLAPVRRMALVGTPLAILAVSAYGWVLGRRLGWSWQEALWFGAFASLSSTMVVLKTLGNAGQLGSLAARVMVGVLIVQDLAFVPLTILLPQLGDLATGLPALAYSLLRAVVFVAVLVWVGGRVVPWLMGRVAAWQSRELFLITVMALGLGVAYLTYLAGLSFAFGAFVAGAVLGASDYSHQALGDIVPLRDVFGLLFFASVGMLVDPAFVFAHAGQVALLVALLLVGKTAILACVAALCGYRGAVPLAVGLGLMQIGELSFVLARQGLSLGALSAETFSLLLASAVVTMALTPAAAATAEPLYAWWRRGRPEAPPETALLPERGLSGHVVVAGGGRVGQHLAHGLVAAGKPLVVVDMDHRRMVQCRAAGLPVVYGDAGSEAVLRAAGVQSARLLVVAIPTPDATAAIIAAARRLGPGLEVVARADSVEAMHILRRLGGADVVQPELEGSVAMLRHALERLALPEGERDAIVDSIRDDLAADFASDMATVFGEDLPPRPAAGPDS